MCGSSALPIIGLGAAALGTGVSAYGMYKAVKAKNAENAYNAKIADRSAVYANEQAGYLDENAAYLKGQAGEAIKAGAKEETNFRRSLGVFISGQKSQFAASGVVVDSGSARDIVNDSARFGEEDALTIRYNAAQKAEAIRQNAVAAEREAKRYRQMSKDYSSNAYMLRTNKTSSALPVLGAVLNGVSSFANSYTQYDKAGAF